MGVGGGRRQRRRREGRGDGFELVGGGCGRVGIAGRHEHLDRGRDHPAAPHRVLVVVEHPTRSCGRGVGPSLGHPEQGQPGLRVVTVLVGRRVSRLRTVEITLEPEHLASLELDLAEGALAQALGHVALLRERELIQRVGPRTLPAHDLRSMHRGLPGELHEAFLLLAPHREQARPVRHAANVVELLTGVDHDAVDATGHHRRDLTGRHADHRLVQQRQALRNLPLVHEHPSLDDQPDGHQIRLAVPAAGLRDRDGQVVRLRRPDHRRHAGTAGSSGGSRTRRCPAPTRAVGRPARANRALAAWFCELSSTIVSSSASRAAARLSPASSCSWKDRCSARTLRSESPTRNAAVAKARRSGGSS